jgi:hypothetical protein
MRNLFRRLAAAGVVVVAFSSGPAPRAQSVAPIDRKITYILPQYFFLLNESPEELAAQAALMRARIGEGLRVKVGFTTYLGLNMKPVDPADPDAVRAALAPVIADIDKAIALAQAANIPICLSFITQEREPVDEAEAAAQAADRRNVMWHSDNSMATGWITLSRYARKDATLREAFVRELGRQVAARMLQYPETLVAASGDGEVELASDGVVPGPDGQTDPVASKLADYSPFAIAEFRDWLRQGGLYAQGQPFAGEGMATSGRYAGDASPNDDSNGDYHTLNGDYGTAFTTWNLKHFDWQLTDSPTADPNAIPESTYNAPGFNKTPNEIPTGFDAPRERNPADAYWKLWDLFRQTMVYRHNLTFARWVTTSFDPVSGATVPADRWFSDQVPADYLFTNVVVLPSSPTGFPQAPTFRLDSSASPLWTADLTPHGSLGITSFNLNVGFVLAVAGDVYYRTLAAAAPAIAARGVRWGIFEWNASTPPTAATTIYDQEMALVEKYRPSILVPFAWNAMPDLRILDSPFETALRNFVIRRNNVPLTLNRSTLYAKTLTDGAARTPAQVVRVSGEPGETPSWNASSSAAFVDIVQSADGRSFTVALKPGSYAAGVQAATVVVTPTPGTGYVSTTLTLNVTASAATLPPLGSFDTPADLQVVTGEVGVTGWAVDDVGVQSVGIWRSPVAGEPAQLVFLGTAGPVEGARPDIEGAYGTLPLNSQAGWGYMLLSNFLPNNGNGVFTLHAIVTDVDGHTLSLGTRRIDCRNATADTPFGTIDTPLQGQTVSGTIVNFGWALTPNPRMIPIDGSTIDVMIDNLPVGHPTYNNFRSDIAGAFPGLANTDGAVGYFYIDTTTLANGVHTISWVARDNMGGATGMGSRFFTVANP